MLHLRHLTVSLVASLAVGCVQNPPTTSSLKATPTAQGASAAESDPASSDWPAWRGPTGDGIAPAGQSPPVTWSETENVVWKAKVPGRGHSSPTVFGDRVFIATAEEDKQLQAVLCFDRSTGDPLWRTDVHSGGLDKKGNEKTTQASSTVACDGERLYINFLNQDAIYTTALTLDGKRLWQTKVSDFKTHQGFGSSPTLYGDLLYVTTDSPAGGVIAALSREKGDVVWKQDRPQKANYASAQVYNLAGQPQVLLQGCDLVASFHPLTGEKLWEMEGSTTECVTSIVTDGERIFVSGGYPRNHVQAIVADGSKKTAWENGTRVYVPSMIVKDGYLYAMLDAGVATCWKSDTGEEIWKSRVGGTFSASLVLADDLLFATSEEGKTIVFKANPERFEKVGENQLGDQAFATPAICGNRIYTRVTDSDGGRQDWLYCLGSN
jgi:outer membrane protein assembly factor BamB